MHQLLLLFDHCSASYTLSTRFSIFEFEHFRLAKSVDSDDVEIVELAFGNERLTFTAQKVDDFRHGIVMTGKEDSLPTMIAGIRRTTSCDCFASIAMTGTLN